MMLVGVDLQMESVRSLRRPEDFLSAVRLQCDMLPEYLPQKFGWSEPLKLPFDPRHLETLIPPARGPGSLHDAAIAAGVVARIPSERYRGGVGETVWWKRTGKRQARGGWMTRWGKELAGSTHASIGLTVFETRYQDELIAYLKAGCVNNDCDFGFLDGCPEGYKSYARENELATAGSHLFVTTHLLRHWLPDMLWATVLGPAYVRMFGKERVLSAPAYLVEELGPETIYLQLTPKLSDINERFVDVMAARQRVKMHLGIDAFFQSALAYDWRKHPESAGKVFRVPEFRLIPD
jgi:hypothetical protein